MRKHPFFSGRPATSPAASIPPLVSLVATDLPPGDQLVALQQEQKALAALNERLRRQLGRSEQLAGLGRVVTGIAHELNNPLAALLGTLELMRELVGEDAPERTAELRGDLRALLADCDGIVDRMKDLVAAVKGMGRDVGREPIAFDPGRALRDAVKVFAVAHRRVCQVELSLPALPAVFGTPSRLGQVVLNLLQNGLDASGARHPELARLAVAAERVGEEVAIRVTDHGAGIPADIAPYVFEPFYTSKPSDKGTGLGLYLCREIVGEMQGTISFESKPGQTVFLVRLPIYCPDAVRSDPDD
jgi:signal transduction histidine kinase